MKGFIEIKREAEELTSVLSLEDTLKIELIRKL
jgi:hypothetical protein